VAEHFWYIPHDPTTYAPEFQGHWGSYLSRVPFRDITVGSYYLGLRTGYRLLFPNVTFRPDAVSAWYSISLKIFFCIALFFFYRVCQKRFGTWCAFLCTALLSLPPQNWFLTNELLAEPFLRLYLLIAATLLILLTNENHKRRWLWGGLLALTIILSALTKTQWILFGIILLPIMILGWWWNTYSWRSLFPFLLVLALVPISLSLVHWIGWQEYALTPGFGLHANRKSGGASTRYACSIGKSEMGVLPRFCATNSPNVDPYWGVNVGQDVSQKEFRLLDRLSKQYFLTQGKNLISDFWSGLKLATTFSRRNQSSTGFLYYGERIVDVLTWLLLLFGLLHRKTFLLASTGLALWIVPSTSMIVENYDERYFFAMAGIPTVLAVLIAVLLWKTKNLCVANGAR